jgi:hypothetical protein
MPIRKARLSRAEEARYLAAAQQLQAAELGCEIPGAWLENSRALDIMVNPPHENFLRELRYGQVGYAVFVRLIARRGGLILEDFLIASGWDSDLIPLRAKEKDLYCFTPSFDFVWDEVLNHRIENRLRFHHRGDMAEGWLLAIGHKPIPDKYRNWMSAPFDVTFADQFGDNHLVSGEACVERSARQKDIGVRPGKSARLFEPRPPETLHLDRQLYRARDQLERLQRQRKSETIPPQFNVNLTRRS